MYAHQKRVQCWRRSLLAFYHVSGPLALMLLLHHYFMEGQQQLPPPPPSQATFCLTCLSRKLVLACGQLQLQNESRLLCGSLFWGDGTPNRYPQLILGIHHLYNKSVFQELELELQARPRSATMFFYKGCVNRSMELSTSQHSYYVDIKIPRPGNTYLKGFL